MRAPRLALLASASLLVAAGAAHAQDAAPAAPPAPQTAPADAMTPAPAPAPGGFTDQELKKFDDAMTQVRAVSDTLNGAQPTPEQQAQMASAIQDSGLEVTRFNAISTAVSSDPELAARIAVLNTAPPAPGTPAASVTDDELTRYVTAMTQIRAVTAEVENGQATPEQSAQLTAAVQGSGLEVERFNAIAQVVSQDDYLQAKAQLIGARAEKGVSQ
ncbi:DUF4168 domain-containing protein [Brevundimonas sp. UBA7534]|uniref:DUF4168 domain-containing protein n=1 Tax=Brevundimonas sp. UBA7534 TaxID=1946138 RepID=UPI0025C5383C|nr:DUF4168 domain-containing protein [Brevundimonas sp. UBA7534]